MFKKILSLVLAVFMLVMTAAIMSSCSKKNDDLKIGVILVGDESEGYTLAHINGIKAAQKALNLRDDQIVWAKKVEENNDCSERAESMVADGCKLIISNSYGHQDYMYSVAKKYPDVNFVAVTGDYAAISGLNNLYNSFNDVYESRYVSGVVAGLKLKEMVDNTKNESYTGTDKLNANNYDVNNNIKIGYVGAFNYAEVVSGYTAFYLGIKSIVENIAMEVVYTDSWFSIPLESAAADKLMADGCVIIGQHADSTGAPAAVEAAHTKGTYTNVYSVGYNVSMLEAAPTVALTSASNNWEVYYETLFKAAVNGDAIPNDWSEGYNKSAVCITDLGKSCAAGTAEKVNTVIDQIKNGSLKVFDVSKFTVSSDQVFCTVEKDASNHLTSCKEDMSFYSYTTGSPVLVHQGEVKEVLKTENGVTYFDESSFRAAPYFNVRIDGITEVAEKITSAN